MKMRFHALGSFLLAGAISVPPHACANTTPVAIGADTHGGAVAGASIIHVTSLADSGPGTLREALSTRAPKIVVFDVGGSIQLKDDLKIASPYVTVAGQTAPSPGITLYGAPLRIRSHDVVVQHIAIRPGPAGSAAKNDNQDSISIDGSPNAGVDHQSFNVRLENVSATWSVDETVSLWFETTRNVTIRNSIVAQALNNAGPPKGAHSMGLLVGANIKGVELTGNLFASNVFRNPAISQGATIFFGNNYIINPGQNASHFYDRKMTSNTTAVFSGNVYEAGSNSKPSIVGILVPRLGGSTKAKTTIYQRDNSFSLGPKGKTFFALPDATLIKVSPFGGISGDLMPAASVKDFVLRHAGTRPFERNRVDALIIDKIKRGKEQIVDTPPMALAVEKARYRVASLPQNPFTKLSTGQYQVEAWLCSQSIEVGGQRSTYCP
jgi:pectate lyase